MRTWINLTEDSLIHDELFLAAFKSLSLSFNSWIVMYLGVNLWVYCLKFVDLECVDEYISSNLGHFWPLFLQIFFLLFSLFPLLLGCWGCIFWYVSWSSTDLFILLYSFFFFPVLRPENLSWLFWFFPLLAQICDWAPLVNSSRVSLVAQLSKESACNAGAPGRFLGQEDGEGNGNPLQYSWASLVAQLVKNPPAIQETWVRSLGWEDPLEKEKATHSSILAWRILWTLCRVT